MTDEFSGYAVYTFDPNAEPQAHLYAEGWSLGEAQDFANTKTAPTVVVIPVEAPPDN